MYSASAPYSALSYPKNPTRGSLLRYAPTLPTFLTSPKDAAQPLEPSKGARIGQHGR